MTNALVSALYSIPADDREVWWRMGAGGRDQGCPYDSDTSKEGSCLMPVSLEDFISTFYYQALKEGS